MTKHRFLSWAAALLGVLASPLCVCAIARGQQGEIEVYQSDNATGITYTVTGTYGPGTPDFRCHITYPSGKREELQASGSPWHAGKSSYTWNFYAEEQRTCRVSCFWFIAGHGRVAEAETTFNR
jgi:hypothetical protein